MDITLRFSDGHERTLIEDVPADFLTTLTPLDALMVRLNQWGVYYGKRKYVPNGGRFVTTTKGTNFEITVVEGK